MYKISQMATKKSNIHFRDLVKHKLIIYHSFIYINSSNERDSSIFFWRIYTIFLKNRVVFDFQLYYSEIEYR